MIYLGDECLNGFLVADLRSAGFDLEWIRETNPGIKDSEVIELAKASGRVLISEDKDFGEWVFAHRVSGLTIIFLRYSKAEYSTILDSLFTVLSKLPFSTNEHSFVTITAGKIRQRNI
ncbi:DUF5615 family PIN-like protein [Neolewinella maritima]|uniref:DUF5615 family PIN-like protein n=1 Tax=Neolewinella maritima TaxID=1383882 RepID=UPI0038730BC1